MRNSALDEFKTRLRDDWLLPFCRAKKLSDEGFAPESVARLSESDAADFLYALDHCLVTQRGPYFFASRSKAKEQIFWECGRSTEPRKLTLWYEPIITIGAVARMVRDFSWTVQQIGMQSDTWAFDLVAYDLIAPV